MVRQAENGKNVQGLEMTSFIEYRKKEPSVEGTMGQRDDAYVFSLDVCLLLAQDWVYFPIVLKFQSLLLLMKHIYWILAFHVFLYHLQGLNVLR